MNRGKLRSGSLFFLMLVLLSVFAFNFSAAGAQVKSGDFVFSVGKSSAKLVQYNGKSASVKIPSKIKGVPVTSIGEYAFYQNKTMKKVTIPKTVKKTEAAAFGECQKLEKVVFPKDFTSLGASTFWYCKGLKKVVLYEKVTSVGKNAFRGCPSNLTVYVCSGSKAEKLVKKIDGIKTAPSYISSLKADKALTIEVGKTQKISVSVSPSNAYNKSLSYSSSNPSAVSVSSSGIVTGKKCAKAVISVRAKDSSGKKVSVSVTVTPRKVSGFKQSKKTKTSHTLSWKASKGAQKYRIYKYNETSKKWTTLVNTTKTSYTVSSLDVGTKTKYCIKAYCKVGKTNIFSDKVTATAVTIVPSKVSDLKVTGQTENSVSLKWKAASNATGYKIYTYNSKKKAYTLKASTKGTSCTVKGLSQSEVYSFSIRSYLTYSKKTTYSSYSSIIYGATKPTACELKAESNGIFLNKVKLCWTAPKGVSGYQIVYREDGMTAWEKQGISTGKTVSAVVSGLKADTEYNFKIRAYFSYAGKTYYGAYSPVLNIITAPEFDPVSYVQEVISSSPTSVTIEWQESDGADGYNIYRFDEKTGEYSFEGSTSGTEYTVSGLEENMEIALAVKSFAKNHAGSFESEQYSPVVKCASAPNPVAGLKVSAIKGDSDSAEVSWNAAYSAVSYGVSYCKAGDETWTSFETDKNSCTLSGLERRAEYIVKVCAAASHYDSLYTSQFCNPVSFQTVGDPSTADEAYKDFETAFLNAANAQNYTLLSNTSILSQSVNKADSKGQMILDAVIQNCVAPGNKIYNFDGGTDSGSGKSAAELLDAETFKNGDKQPKNLSFAKDGSGFSVSFDIADEDAQNYGGFFASKADQSEFEKLGLNIISQEREITVTNAKFTETDLNSMKITEKLQMRILFEEEIYTVELTKVSIHAFLAK